MLVEEGRLDADPAQKAAILKLTDLAGAVEARNLARKASHLGWLFGRNAPVEPPRGLYIWGAVGRGKTMLMDLFFDAVEIDRKRRAHFHAFMADCQDRLHAYREDGRTGEPIARLADEIAAEARLLCFDEFGVTDIADAMILGRLFEALFARSVTIVATSNVPPAELYRDGLNRALFLPFIDLIERRMEVLHLAARTDYRLEKIGADAVHHAPADAAAKAALDALWRRLTGSAAAHGASLPVKSRRIAVPAAARGVARFLFPALCETPLSGSDYLAIARAFHTVIVDEVPRFSPENRNAARRFITAIDVFYERGVKLAMSAAAPAQELGAALDGKEGFEFARTASRLVEMASTEYIARPRAGTTPAPALEDA
jgi:cell division protein ZapE